ncbi:MAG: GNAT family N-acetyltransferase [archaeon]|nr:GNAT family N-acetyltransferase [Nanoarchaeota archaeon]
MDIIIVEDIQECELLWKKFSPQKSLWELWDIVISFYDQSIYVPYFLVLLNDKKKQEGLLPLWLDKTNDKYYFFSATYPENRKFWFDLKYFPLFFEKIPEPTRLFDINAEVAEKITEKFPEYKEYVSLGENHYFIDLEKLNSIELFLKNFSKKHRKNFLNDIEKLENLNFQIVWEELEHFDDFVKFNVQRFGEDSDFNDPQFVKEMISFLNVLKKMEILFACTILIDGKVEGVEFAAFHEKVYYILNGGCNRNIKNVGKFIIFQHIKNALSLKAKKVDLLSGDTGWKELWNCDKEPYYDFRKE